MPSTCMSSLRSVSRPPSAPASTDRGEIVMPCTMAVLASSRTSTSNRPNRSGSEASAGGSADSHGSRSSRSTASPAPIANRLSWRSVRLPLRWLPSTVPLSAPTATWFASATTCPDSSARSQHALRQGRERGHAGVLQPGERGAQGGRGHGDITLETRMRRHARLARRDAAGQPQRRLARQHGPRLAHLRTRGRQVHRRAQAAQRAAREGRSLGGQVDAGGQRQRRGAHQHRQPGIQIDPACGQRHIEAWRRRHPHRDGAFGRRAADLHGQIVRRRQPAGDRDASFAAEWHRRRRQQLRQIVAAAADAPGQRAIRPDLAAQLRRRCPAAVPARPASRRARPSRPGRAA